MAKGSKRGTGVIWSKEEDAELMQLVGRGRVKDWGVVSSSLGGRNAQQCKERWGKIGTQVKKGPWSADDDGMLRGLVESHGVGKWSAIAEEMKVRNGKQCRERWVNHLDPTIKHGPWTAEEEDTLLSCYKELGPCWAKISARLPGRPDNKVKNHFNGNLRKRLEQEGGIQPRRKKAGKAKAKGKKKETTASKKKKAPVSRRRPTRRRSPSPSPSPDPDLSPSPSPLPVRTSRRTSRRSTSVAYTSLDDHEFDPEPKVVVSRRARGPGSSSTSSSSAVASSDIGAAAAALVSATASPRGRRVPAKRRTSGLVSYDEMDEMELKRQNNRRPRGVRPAQGGQQDDELVAGQLLSYKTRTRRASSNQGGVGLAAGEMRSRAQQHPQTVQRLFAHPQDGAPGIKETLQSRNQSWAAPYTSRLSSLQSTLTQVNSSSAVYFMSPTRTSANGAAQALSSANYNVFNVDSGNPMGRDSPAQKHSALLPYLSPGSTRVSLLSRLLTASPGILGAGHHGNLGSVADSNSITPFSPSTTNNGLLSTPQGGAIGGANSPLRGTPAAARLFPPEPPQSPAVSEMRKKGPSTPKTPGLGVLGSSGNPLDRVLTQAGVTAKCVPPGSVSARAKMMPGLSGVTGEGLPLSQLSPSSGSTGERLSGNNSGASLLGVTPGGSRVPPATPLSSAPLPTPPRSGQSSAVEPPPSPTTRAAMGRSDTPSTVPSITRNRGTLLKSRHKSPAESLEAAQMARSRSSSFAAAEGAEIFSMQQNGSGGGLFGGGSSSFNSAVMTGALNESLAVDRPASLARSLFSPVRRSVATASPGGLMGSALRRRDLEGGEAPAAAAFSSAAISHSVTYSPSRRRAIEATEASNNVARNLFSRVENFASMSTVEGGGRSIETGSLTLPVTSGMESEVGAPPHGKRIPTASDSTLPVATAST